jgi:hypothetical protein
MKVVVQHEIQLEKCEKCDEYGRIEKVDGSGTAYYPFCGCEFGAWKKRNESAGDMFYQARHDL